MESAARFRWTVVRTLLDEARSVHGFDTLGYPAFVLQKQFKPHALSRVDKAQNVAAIFA